MFEKILYSHLQSCTAELSQHLAQYGNRMAIFMQEAPDDQSPDWGEGSQYGRIVFSVNMQNNAERIVSGTLTVDVICDDTQSPEVLEQITKPLIDGYFFTTTNHVISAHWNTSNYFTDSTMKESGVTIAFSLLAFPKQIDLINVLNNYTKELIPNSFVIGLDNIQTVWKPTNTAPAIYWRLVNTAPCSWIPSTYACEWRTATCQAHIYASDKDIETTISRTIDNGFSFKKSLRMPDGTYMRTDRNIRINPGADTLKQGQVTIEVTYGVLRQYSETEKITNVHVTSEIKEGGE